MAQPTPPLLSTNAVYVPGSTPPYLRIPARRMRALGRVILVSAVKLKLKVEDRRHQSGRRTNCGDGGTYTRPGLNSVFFRSSCHHNCNPCLDVNSTYVHCTHHRDIYFPNSMRLFEALWALTSLPHCVSCFLHFGQAMKFLRVTWP